MNDLAFWVIDKLVKSTQKSHSLHGHDVHLLVICTHCPWYSSLDMIIVNPNLPHMSLESGQPLEELRHRWWTPQHACTVYCWPSLAAHQGDKSCTYRGKQLINKLRKWLIHKFYTRTSKSCSHCMGRPLSVKRALTERRGNRITSTCLGLTVSTQGPSESWQLCYHSS